MIKHLICSDIDGTLMTNQQTISQDTLNYIHQLQNEGHLFFVATGRMYLSALKIAETIGSHVGVIASNGGIVSINDKIIQHTLDKQTSLKIYRLAMEYHLPLFFFTKDTIYYSLILPNYFKNETDQGRVDTGKQESYVFIENEEFLSLHAHEFINAIIISEDQKEALKQAKEKLSLWDTLTVSSSFWNNIEICPRGISKAIAIKKIQNAYQISSQYTISFGDGENDIDMFKVSDISVAMENANDKVKSHAKFATTTNNEDGVYKFLIQYFKENNYGK